MRGSCLRAVALVAVAVCVLLTPPTNADPLPKPAVLEQLVRLPDPARLGGGILTSPDGHRAANVLNDTHRYALGTWWPTVAPALITKVTRTPQQLGSSDAVRRLGMQAMALAVGVRAGGYDPVRVGASQAHARRVAVSLVGTVAANHIANRPGGWGGGGQSGLWTSFTGRAAWLLWSDLPPSTRVLVQKMLLLEADLALQVPVLYLRDRGGEVVRPGNSASEENSWNALPLQLATAMLPRHAHWTAWRHRQVELMLSSWARPQDVTDVTPVNGAPIAAWLDGSNVEANGLVVNHSRIAPDYATTIYQNVDAILVDALAGLATPQAARWGIDHVYAGLSEVDFSGRRFLAPGGTIYQADQIYYPQGCDWGTGQALPYALVDAQSAAFGFGTPQSAAHESAHLAQHRRLTARFRHGGTYAFKSEYRYVGREEHTAQLAAQLYLTKLVRDRGLATFTNEPFFAPAARDLTGLLPVPETPFTEVGLRLP